MKLKKIFKNQDGPPPCLLPVSKSTFYYFELNLLFCPEVRDTSLLKFDGEEIVVQAPCSLSKFASWGKTQ